jgi:hypothetical protein
VRDQDAVTRHAGFYKDIRKCPAKVTGTDDDEGAGHGNLYFRNRYITFENKYMRGYPVIKTKTIPCNEKGDR